MGDASGSECADCDVCKFDHVRLSTGEQGAGVREPAGSGSLGQPAGRRGGGGEDHPGQSGSDRRPGAHQLHQLGRSESDVWILCSATVNVTSLCSSVFVCMLSSSVSLHLCRLPCIQVPSLLRVYGEIKFYQSGLPGWQHGWDEIRMWKNKISYLFVICYLLKSRCVNAVK